MTIPEHLQKFLEEKEKADEVCKFCLYDIDCNHRAVSGGPNGPIYAPCADGEPERYIDVDALQEAYDEERSEND